MTFTPDRRDELRLQWTPHAFAVLEAVPNPMAVLRRFVLRFRTSHWRGSRAAEFEAFADLIDQLPPGLTSEGADLQGLRKDLEDEIEAARRRDAAFDRSFERFE